MAKHGGLSPGAEYSAARKDRRRSRTQIYAYDEQDSNTALSQSHEYLRPRRRDPLSESSRSLKPVSSIESMGILVAPSNVARALSSSGIDPQELPEHDSGNSEIRNTLQSTLQFEPSPTMGHSTKDHPIEQLESIGSNCQGSTFKQRPLYVRERRYLKRSYQDIPPRLLSTKTLCADDDVVTTGLRLSTKREGSFELPGTARPCRGLPDRTNPIVVSQTSTVPLLLAVTSQHDFLTPSSKGDASYFPIQSNTVRTAERSLSPTPKCRSQRASSSGTTIFTPPLITTASPNSEKSGNMQSSSSDSSGESKERMIFL